MRGSHPTLMGGGPFFLKETLTLRNMTRGSLARFSLAVVLLLSVAAAVPSSAWAIRPLQSLNAVVSISPAELTVDPGETFTVEVIIREVSDLGSYKFSLAYDPDVVEVREAESGGFVEETGRSVIVLGPDIDNEVGRVDFSATSFEDTPGAEGSGTLAVLSLEAMADGVSELRLVESGLKIFRPTGSEMRVRGESGQVQVGAGATPTATPSEPAGIPTMTPTDGPAQPTATPDDTEDPTATRDDTADPTATVEEGTDEPTQAPTATSTLDPAASPSSTPEPSATEPTGTEATLRPTDTEATATATGELTGPATATAGPLATGTDEAEGESDALLPTATPGGLGVDDEGQPPSGGPSRWLILGAVVLALGGVALIAGGLFFFGSKDQASSTVDEHGGEGDHTA